ncbi:MAG: acyl-CoA dehydrogenase family protein [Gammaproteobacteria bacterium]|nr:acyl-CoA dehydrogenase family protein [Gammaproteobacteria bacterium]
MTTYTPPIEDMQFLLFDVFDVERDWQRAGLDIDRMMVTGLLDECGKLATNVMAPLSQSSDKEGAHWDQGTVTAPTGFSGAFAEIQSGGWIGMCGNPDFGGQGMPRVLGTCVDEMFWAANSNLWLYGSLTSGATYCIDAHATEELKETYLPSMYEGRWTGAMALTEPHAGTDLGLLRTKAKKQLDGSYKLNGTKIFITSGEHDLADNIIHLVLARVEGAPAGTRGISLFLVPKFLPDDDSSLTIRNGFRSASIEHKMGIRGSATSVINYEDAVGYLVGSENSGLRHMFTMMNFARLSVGVQGLGLSAKAYQLASTYTKERVQGRAPSGPKQPDDSADAIIEHPDVRRMLLTQRAFVEGGRALSVLVSSYLDKSIFATDESEQQQNFRLVELLTPLAKAFMSDRGLEVASLAQQCFGGAGYIQETGIEQVVRDVRITQIYEGTNGIQALDFIGRKVLMDGAQTLRDFIQELLSFDMSDPFKEKVSCALSDLVELTDWLLEHAATNPDLSGSVSVEFLDYCGYITYAALWARMAATDDSRFQKSLIANFYFDKILPRTGSLRQSIMAGSESVMKPESDWF